MSDFGLLDVDFRHFVGLVPANSPGNPNPGAQNTVHFGQVFYPPLTFSPQDFSALSNSSFPTFAISNHSQSVIDSHEYRYLLNNSRFSGLLETIEKHAWEKFGLIGTIRDSMGKEGSPIFVGNSGEIAIAKLYFILALGPDSYQMSKQILTEEKIWIVVNTPFAGDVLSTFVGLTTSGITQHLGKLFQQSGSVRYVKEYFERGELRGVKKSEGDGGRGKGKMDFVRLANNLAGKILKVFTIFWAGVEAAGGVFFVEGVVFYVTLNYVVIGVVVMRGGRKVGRFWGGVGKFCGELGKFMGGRVSRGVRWVWSGWGRGNNSDKLSSLTLNSTTLLSVETIKEDKIRNKISQVITVDQT